MIIGLDFLILNSITNHSPLVITFKYALALLSIILYCLFHYTLYLYTTRRITLKRALVVAFFLMIKHLGSSIIMLLSHVVLIGIVLFQPGLGLLFIFSGSIYTVTYLCRHFIKIKENIQ